MKLSSAHFGPTVYFPLTAHSPRPFEPRSTLDVDMVVALDEQLGRGLVKALEEFYVDPTAIDRAVANGRTLSVSFACGASD